jgi:cytochrome c-type biogenesis protein CcmH
MKTAGQTQQHSGNRLPLLLACALVPLGSILLYTQMGAPGYGDLGLESRIEMAETLRANRPDQITAEQSVPPNVPDASVTAEYTELVERLRTAVAERPDDLQGHRLLAQSEARLGNLGAAHLAQARVISMTGGPEADLQDWTTYADLLVLAAGGYVSPEAERVLGVILEKDRTNPVGRYYWGLMMRQTGRPDIAFRLWDRLLRESPSNAPWVAPIRAQMPELAQFAGVPNYQMPEPGSQRGPTQADVDAAQDMSPEERMSMIEGMVGGLAARLGEEGGPPEDWAQLITALGVLGRQDEAAAIFAEASGVFADVPAAMDMLNRAADRAGVK